jgi:hypothetical protein
MPMHVAGLMLKEPGRSWDSPMLPGSPCVSGSRISTWTRLHLSREGSFYTLSVFERPCSSSVSTVSGAPRSVVVSLAGDS